MRAEANRDEALEALWKVREAEIAEEEAYERRKALFLAYVDWIEGLPDDVVLTYFREDGGDPAVGVEEARQAMLEALVVDRW